MRGRAAVAVWLFTVSAGLALAQPGPLDRAEQDRRTAKAVYESALLGSELFNKGNHEGCFRLYQGTLIAVQPLLDHRPKLAAFVKEQLDKSANLSAAMGAFELRKALDAVQQETATALTPTPTKGATTTGKEPPAVGKTGPALWDRLGGEKTVRVVVKDFLTAAGSDPKVNVTRDGKYTLDEKGMARLEQSVVELVSQVTGGPLKYHGKDMATVHAGMKITDAEFNAMAVHLVKTLQKHKVSTPETLELLEIIGASRRDIVGK